MKFQRTLSIVILFICFANILLVYSLQNDIESLILNQKNVTKTNQTQFDDSTRYIKASINGFTTFINKDVPKDDYDLIREVLEERTATIVGSINETTLNTLQKTNLWIEKNNPRGKIAEVHFSGGWLARNNFNPAKLGGIEISNIKEFVIALRNGEPNLLLHELAHCLQFFKKLDSGDFDNKLKNTFENAINSGLYDSVKSIYNDEMTNAYAKSNMKEYFSELTESYFNANDYYPFNLAQLKEYDPLGFQLMEEVWRKN